MRNVHQISLFFPLKTYSMLLHINHEKKMILCSSSLPWLWILYCVRRKMKRTWKKKESTICFRLHCKCTTQPTKFVCDDMVFLVIVNWLFVCVHFECMCLRRYQCQSEAEKKERKKAKCNATYFFSFSLRFVWPKIWAHWKGNKINLNVLNDRQ